MSPATPQDTFDHVFGSGALQYEWWLLADYHVPDESDSAADDWAVDVTADDGNGGQKTVTVNHVLILRTARYVHANRGAQGPRADMRPAWSSALERECTNLLFDADNADFDADLADELLQLVVLGEVGFG